MIDRRTTCSSAAQCGVSFKTLRICVPGQRVKRGAKTAGRRCVVLSIFCWTSANVEVVVCIVSDGRLKINPRTRSVLAALGVYQDGVGTNVVNGKPVVCERFTLRQGSADIPRRLTCTSIQPNVSSYATWPQRGKQLTSSMDRLRQ